MIQRTLTLLIAVLWTASSVHALSQNVQNRRELFQTLVAYPVAASLVVATRPAEALDMDSFMNQQLANDSVKPVLSDDAALCKYGSPSKATGEACLRAGMSTKRSGTLDAFGTVDRGDYVKCKQFYKETETGYGKVTECENK